ncbi:TPA: hypothetical protein ACS5XN_004806 [Salmonella enterica]|nr:hypothetical protein [Salmonella enterica]
MKEVKIYTIVSDQLSPPITGESFCTDMVRHSDYAELDAKYAALAADNDKAMESLKQANAVVKLAHEKFSAMAAENTALKKSDVEFNEYCRRECEDVGDTWVDDFTETPATDAFLAEVRASAIPEGLNIRAIAALRAAVRNQWLKSDNFADKVYWKSMHSIANEIVEAMMKNEPHQPTENHIPSREAIIAGGVLVQCPRCYNDSYRLNVNGLTHYWCDKCANSITSESK